MAWTPITTAEQLIARFESSSLDYKTTYELRRPTIRYDLAKDVAAFATAFGGTIVVGVVEQAGRVVALPGIADVPKLTAEVAAALLQLCAPVPSTPEEHALIITPAQAARILAQAGAAAPTTDVTLVTLNVRADARSPIGVRPVNSSGAPLAQAYRFPVRIDDQTRFLDPTELPMWMNSHERRMAVALGRLLEGAGADGVGVRMFDANGAFRDVQLRKVDEEELVVELTGRGGDVRVPLTYVSAVWRDAVSLQLWSMNIRGWVYGHAELRFKPPVESG